MTDTHKQPWEHVEDLKKGLSQATEAVDKLRSTELLTDLLFTCDYGRTRAGELLDELESALRRVSDARRRINERSQPGVSDSSDRADAR